MFILFILVYIFYEHMKLALFNLFSDYLCSHLSKFINLFVVIKKAELWTTATSIFQMLSFLEEFLKNMSNFEILKLKFSYIYWSISKSKVLKFFIKSILLFFFYHNYIINHTRNNCTGIFLFAYCWNNSFNTETFWIGWRQCCCGGQLIHISLQWFAFHYLLFHKITPLEIEPLSLK